MFVFSIFIRIFLAGADTATYWVGYMSGGVQSGQRAAHEVLHHLAPELLAEKDLQGTAFGPKL